MNMITLTCKQCSREFQKYEPEYNSSLKAGRQNFFCNLKCATVFQCHQRAIRNRENYYKAPNICKYCNVIIQYEKKETQKIYCSRKCSLLDNKEIMNIHRTKHGEYCDKQCRICNKISKYKTCSYSCRTELSRINRMNKLKNNLFPNTPSNGNTIRKALIDIRGVRCESCNLSKWNIKNILSNQSIETDIPLTLHHMDGNASNNRIENLQLLCWNCHSLTDNYGSRNKNSARREYRMKYGNT